MIAGRVSVLIPSRQERYLPQTVADLLAKARGDLEIVVVLDGYWPNPPLPDDKRLKLFHVGQARGMRPAINAASRMATGEYFLKSDAHTAWDEGFDLKLKAEYKEHNWILTLRRYALDAEAWAIDQSNPGKYPIDYHYLSNPLSEFGGLHGVPWPERREARKDLMLDDEMTSQGSAWFMSRKHWDWLGELDAVNYGTFPCEFQELGLKTWLGGGAVKVTKRTWYAHWHKRKQDGRGYPLSRSEKDAGKSYCRDYWTQDRYPQAVRTLRSLVEQFSPVPTWPADLDTVFSVLARA